ncbi:MULTISPECIES: hypothetical protein [Microbacterium]|uniref:DUF11 domain-containing protein n=1 Tax=Microbacterium oxydans TaxID=82380 RepID=A0A3S9WFR8_9MICO|nr:MULTISPECIES: hypothetical protein [Microbacterium]AZS38903.1 hypothetical protein CVS54_00200 [Microbacterium oxydans]
MSRKITATLLASASILAAGVALAPSASADTIPDTAAPIVTISDGVDSVQRGETVRLTMTVKNTTDISQVYDVTGMLPDGFTAVKATDLPAGVSSPYYIAPSYAHAFVKVAPGQTRTVAFDAKATADAPEGTASFEALSKSMTTSYADLAFATPDVDQVR